MGPDEQLIANAERAQAKAHRWGSIEIVLVSCTVVVVLGLALFALFIAPIRHTINQDQCIVQATAIAVADYQGAVSTFQNTPAGSVERSAGNEEIVRSVARLRNAVRRCE